MIVRCRRHKLDYFRAKARRTPVEIYGQLVGIIHNQNLVEIVKIYSPKVKLATKSIIEPDDESLGLIEDFAQACNLRVLGTIHSHTNCPPILSDVDFIGFKSDLEIVQGIVSVSNGKTWVTFWQQHSSLPCSIEYTQE